MNVLYFIQLIIGFYPRKIQKRVRSLPWFFRTKKEFIRLLKNNGGKEFPITKNLPCLLDRYEEGGNASGHYFHQDLLVAQEICKANPSSHVDIGSRVDGFVSHVASFREVIVLDIRDITSDIENIRFIQADCMSKDFQFKEYCDSVSSLHAIEHFGLGRYGDSLDPDGHLKGLDNIYKMLKKGGMFYFSVPIGPQRIEFNGQRVFSIEYLQKYFEDKYSLKSFSYVDDKGDLHKDIEINEEIIKTNCNCRYGCGIFFLQKK